MLTLTLWAVCQGLPILLIVIGLAWLALGGRLLGAVVGR